MSKRSKLEKIVIEKGRTYLGVVEDNNDPERLCRCKIRVFDVHDAQDWNIGVEWKGQESTIKNGKYQIETKNLPWATPWKDLNGNTNTVPDIGKVLIVVFENGNPNTPEYISANHYNRNLELKLDKENMSQADYLSMKSLLFDHKTQIYVNESEGLKFDHKFNNINIKDDSININLKDNHDSTIYIGTPGATQRAILGDNFMDWFDKFLDLFQSNTAMLGNIFFPIASSPALLEHIAYYKAIRDPKLLSKHVKIVDNDSVRKQQRLTDSTIGDNWESTVKQNELSTVDDVPYTPTDGSSGSTFPTDDSNKENNSKTEPLTKEPHPDCRTIIQLMKQKGYILNTDTLKLNLIAVRKQCLKPGDPYTDEFNDTLYIMYMNEKLEWVVNNYSFSTVAGKDFTITEEIISERIKLDSLTDSQVSSLREISVFKDGSATNVSRIGTKITVKEYLSIKGQDGARILAPSQYIDSFELRDGALYSRPQAKLNYWYDKELYKPDFYPEWMNKPIVSSDTIKIGKGFPNGKKVGNWSIYGDHCLPTKDSLKDLINMCQKHIDKYGNSLTYTLVMKDDWDEASKNAEVNKDDPSIDPNKVGKEKPEEKPAEVVNKPIEKPAELPGEKDVLAFQVWVNKNGASIPEDNTWSTSVQDVWQSNGKNFLKGGSTGMSTVLKLAYSRLQPYGYFSTSSEGTSYKSDFRNGSYELRVFDDGSFLVMDAQRKNENGYVEGAIYMLKGKYEDGFLSIIVTEDTRQPGSAQRTVKDEDAWANIRKII